jgi:hypothetical protein
VDNLPTEVAAATTETSTATPSAVHPPPTSVVANVVASEKSVDLTEKLPGQSPKNPEVAACSADLAPPT